MAINLEKIKSRLNSFSNNGKSNLIWKPAPGKQVIRIVPYKHNTENPFIELKFHYGLNGKTYLSPDSFNRPDPIVEFSNKLKRSGDKEEWKFGRKIEPKMRTFAPVIVRGQESEGVKFWGFGKTVYQELLGYFADPDYGDLSHPLNGRDIIVEYSAPEGGATYPTTTIRVKPNATKLVDDNEKIKQLMDSQKDITTIYKELTYDELKVILQNWLSGNTTEDGAKSATQETVVAKSEKAVEDSFDFDTPSTKPVETLPWDDEPAAKPAPKAKPAPAPAAKTQEVADAFDELFK